MSVARNAPCPCGSGRKYKQCHGRSGATLTRPVALPMWAIVGMVVVAIGATALLFNASQRNRANAVVGPATGFNNTLPSSMAGPDPAPYQYDAATNRHWDPTHRHWHDGPAPDSLVRANMAPGATITPVPTATTPATGNTAAARATRATKAATKAPSSTAATPAPATDATAGTSAPTATPAAGDTTPR